MRLIDADALDYALLASDEDIYFHHMLEDAPTIDAIPVKWLVNLKNEYTLEGREQAEGDLMNLLMMWQKEQEAQDG